ncbi:MAG: exodeoxyribonuclease VII small subunit [Pseudomonadota bacterium]
MSAESKKESTSKENQSFEEAFSELEKLVKQMEAGEQNLEESLQNFERGVNLMQTCHSILKQAEQQVEVLIAEKDGTFAARPLDEQD